KNKGSKEDLNGDGGSPPALLSLRDEGNNMPFENPETGSRGEEENEGSSIRDSDMESLLNCSGSTDSRKDRPGSSSGSSSTGSSSSSSGCCSGNFSEEEGDGCLDDWEAVADALTADEKQHHQNSGPPSQQEIPVEPDTPVTCSELPKKTGGVDIPKPECRNIIPQAASNNRAWRSDDAFRPHSLPNLPRQCFTMITEQRHLVHGSDAWLLKTTLSEPSSCPICYEDLDLTDSSFLPCICGFRLCLFCHKRIFEVGDGRCPGCRRPYDPIDGNAMVNGAQSAVCEGAQAFRLPRCCSMSRRSTRKVSY
ncbi:General negative regulator of transcription subunit, partial [Thalictrum thalictroides]